MRNMNTGVNAYTPGFYSGQTYSYIHGRKENDVHMEDAHKRFKADAGVKTYGDYYNYILEQRRKANGCN